MSKQSLSNLNELSHAQKIDITDPYVPQDTISGSS